MEQDSGSSLQRIGVRVLGVFLILGVLIWAYFLLSIDRDSPRRQVSDMLDEAVEANEQGQVAESLGLLRKAAEVAHRARMASTEAESRANLESMEARAWLLRAQYALRQVQETYAEAKAAAVRAGRTFAIPAGALEEPLGDLQRVLELNPANATAHYLTGFIYREQGRLPKAAEAFEKAIDNSDAFPEAHNALGEALYMLRRYEGALDHFEKALLLRDEYPGAHLNLGLYYASKAPADQTAKDIAKAREHLEAFMRQARQQPKANAADLQRAAQILSRLPNPESATP